MLFESERGRMKRVAALARRTIMEEWRGPGNYHVGIQAVTNPADRAFYDGSREGLPNACPAFFDPLEQVGFALETMRQTGFATIVVFRKAGELDICDISVGPDADGRQQIAITYKDMSGETAVSAFHSDQAQSPDYVLRYAALCSEWFTAHRDDPTSDLEALGTFLASHEGLNEAMLEALRGMSNR